MTDRAADQSAGGMTPERWQEVKRVFEAALERPAGERSAYVASACGPDTLLRQEVESLLHVHEESGGFLGTPAVNLAGASDWQPSVLSPGQALGRYRALGLLGVGGMGQVYLAEDPALGRKVALKLLPRSVSADPDRLRRFRDEARAASALSHPNVCVVYEVGETDDARPYIAMEHVPGESLRQALERHRAAGTRMPLSDVLDVARQAAAGLHAAHEAGVVHRDVKPENVMVRPDGLVKVLDFGLAKLADRPTREREGSVRTEPGMVLGTVRYMSPEQARGLPMDARTDVWSLGVVLYEMLAGHPPFEGATASDVMVAVLDREPVPLAVLAPDTPPVLRDAVSRALAKDRDGRYANVADIARQLEALRRELDRSWGEPPPAPAEAPDGAPMPERAGAAAGTIVARHVRRWPALLALALIVASGGVWLVGREWTAREGASENRDRPLDQKYVVAVLPFESLSADTAKGYIAAGMTEEVTSQLSRLSALRVLSRAALAPYRSTTDRLPRMVRELGVGSVVEGSVRAEGDRARIAVQLIDARSGQAIWSQQYDRQLSDVFAVQRQVAQSITGALEATLTPEEARRAGRPPTVNLEAYELYMRAQRAPGGNLEQHTTATQMLRRAIALDSTFARAYVALGRRYLFMGYMNPAYQDSGLIAVRRAVAVDPNSADAHHMLGNLQGESGQLMVSKASLLKALDLAPSLQFAYNDLSITLDILGEYDQALHWAVRGAPLAPTNPVTYYHVGVPLLRLGDDATVERYLVDAEQRFKGFPRLHIQLAHLDVLRGRHGAALDRARQLAAKYPRSEEVQLALAEVAVIARAPDAEALAGSFAATAPEARAVILPESMRTLHAWTLAASGRRAEADALWNEALATAQRDVERGNGKPDRPMEIAAIHAVHGDTAAALEWLERGYRTGFKDYRILALDPFFDGLRVHPQFRRIAARMQAEVTEMRRRAAAVHDTLFTARRVGDATAAVAPSGAR